MFITYNSFGQLNLKEEKEEVIQQSVHVDTVEVSSTGGLRLKTEGTTDLKSGDLTDLNKNTNSGSNHKVTEDVSLRFPYSQYEGNWSFIQERTPLSIFRGNYFSGIVRQNLNKPVGTEGLNSVGVKLEYAKYTMDINSELNSKYNAHIDVTEGAVSLTFSKSRNARGMNGYAIDVGVYQSTEKGSTPDSVTWKQVDVGIKIAWWFDLTRSKHTKGATNFAFRRVSLSGFFQTPCFSSQRSTEYKGYTVESKIYDKQMWGLNLQANVLTFDLGGDFALGIGGIISYMSVADNNTSFIGAQAVAEFYYDYYKIVEVKYGGKSNPDDKTRRAQSTTLQVNVELFQLGRSIFKF